MSPRLIFGREPALWLGLIAVAVQFVSAFWVNVSADQQAVVNAAAAAAVGLLVAVSTHDGVSAAALGLVRAAGALAVGFGLRLDAEHQAVLMAAAEAIAAMWTRTQVTAKVTRDGVRLAA